MESCSNTWCFVMALFSLSVMFSRVYLCSIPFYCWIMFHRMDTPHFVYTLLGWWAFGLFLPLSCSEECCCEWLIQVFMWHVFSFPLSMCLEVELVGPLVTLCSAFWRPAGWFSVTAVPVHLLASSGGVPASPHPHGCLLLFVFLILAVLVCVWSCFAVVLFCFCLKANDVEYLVYCFVIGRLYMFFGEMSVLVLCSFFSCVVCLLFCCKLCTFWMQILHQTCDWQIIFSCRLSFHVLTGSLWGPSYLFWWNPI